MRVGYGCIHLTVLSRKYISSTFLSRLVMRPDFAVSSLQLISLFILSVFVASTFFVAPRAVGLSVHNQTMFLYSPSHNCTISRQSHCHCYASVSVLAVHRPLAWQLSSHRVYLSYKICRSHMTTKLARWIICAFALRMFEMQPYPFSGATLLSYRYSSTLAIWYDIAEFNTLYTLLCVRVISAISSLMCTKCCDCTLTARLPICPMERIDLELTD